MLKTTEIEAKHDPTHHHSNNGNFRVEIAHNIDIRRADSLVSQISEPATPPPAGGNRYLAKYLKQSKSPPESIHRVIGSGVFLSWIIWEKFIMFCDVQLCDWDISLIFWIMWWWSGVKVYSLYAFFLLRLCASLPQNEDEKIIMINNL